ncbi:MAG: sporulation protein YqfD [Ruminococcus sp.]|nr:sporulation protein YqfD [Ruminococcus sp.]
MKGQLTGWCRVSAKGREVYSFINALRRRGVRSFGQYCKNQVFYCQVSRRDMEVLRETAQEYHIEITVREVEDFSAGLRRKTKRVGLIIGAFAVLFTSCYFSSVVVTIDIQGNSQVCQEDILAALEDIGIHRGTPFREIDFPQTENKLRLMVDGIARAGMHRTGHRLVVEVTEATPKPDMVLDRIPCNILASHEAEIVRTTVLDGMLMHKVGDYVFAGDLLISGVTTDDTGRTVLHHAMGTIIGKYKEEVSFECEYTLTESVPTGRKYESRVLHILSLDVPIFSGKSKFESAVCESREKPVNFFGAQLPMSLETKTYTEYAEKEVTLDREQAGERLMDKVYLYEKNFLPDTEILSRDIDEEEKENSLRYTVRYTLQGDICDMREIYIK